MKLKFLLVAASLSHVGSATVAFQQHIYSFHFKQTPVGPGGKVKVTSSASEDSSLERPTQH